MGGFNAFAGFAAIVSTLFIVLTLTFFGAICFVADDIRRHLKQLTDNLPPTKAVPPSLSASTSPSSAV